MGIIRMRLTLVVLTDHWTAHSSGTYIADMKKLGFNAGYSLMLYNVISGFLITYTLTRNYGDDVVGVRRYYANRWRSAASRCRRWRGISSPRTGRTSSRPFSYWDRTGGWHLRPIPRPLGGAAAGVRSGLVARRGTDILPHGAFHR
jgi:hypothetical protein